MYTRLLALPKSCTAAVLLSTHQVWPGLGQHNGRYLAERSCNLKHTFVHCASDQMVNSGFYVPHISAHIRSECPKIAYEKEKKKKKKKSEERENKYGVPFSNADNGRSVDMTT